MICKYKNCNNKTEPIKNWGTKYKLYCSRDCRYLEYKRDNRYSAGNRLQKNKKYLSRYPTLVKEFNYELNDFLPKDISYGSSKLVWWTCSEGHNYESSANTRTNMRAGQRLSPIDPATCLVHPIPTQSPHTLARPTTLTEYNTIVNPSTCSLAASWKQRCPSFSGGPAWRWPAWPGTPPSPCRSGSCPWQQDP